MLSDEWLSRYGLLENFNASVTRMLTGTVTGTGTLTNGLTAIALCTSCSRPKNSVKLPTNLSHAMTSKSLMSWCLKYFCAVGALCVFSYF